MGYSQISISTQFTVDSGSEIYLLSRSGLAARNARNSKIIAQLLFQLTKLADSYVLSIQFVQ